MAIFTEAERIETLDAHASHWEEAEKIADPFEIVPGYGLPQFKLQRDEYRRLVDKIDHLSNEELSQLRAQRDALFGFSAQDERGVWSRLVQYKATVQGVLGRHHVLSYTVPNIGRVQVSSYLFILDRFLDHWGRANGASALPLTLGTFSHADLQAIRDQIAALMGSIERMENGEIPTLRSTRNVLFGDVPEELRLDTSIFSRLLFYRTTIINRWRNQPIALSLPRFYPEQAKEKVPTFAYNWIVKPDFQIKTWFRQVALEKSAWLYLQEGEITQQQALEPTSSGSLQIHEWTDITVEGEIDTFELRDVDGRTLYRGKRDSSIPEPA